MMPNTPACVRMMPVVELVALTFFGDCSDCIVMRPSYDCDIGLGMLAPLACS
jgi:hypothetical protein